MPGGDVLAQIIGIAAKDVVALDLLWCEKQHPAEKKAKPTGMNLYENTARAHQGASSWRLAILHLRIHGLKK